MTLDFSQASSLKLKAKKLGYVVFGKKTFEHIIKERLREHIKYNERLLKETLENPDTIKQDDECPNIYLYVKRIQKYYLSPDITVNVKKFRYFTVVVEKNYRFIITIYPSSKIAGGKQIWTH